MYADSHSRVIRSRLLIAVVLVCVLRISRSENNATFSPPQSLLTATNANAVWAVEQVHLSVRNASYIIVHWVTPRLGEAVGQRVLTASQVTFHQGGDCTIESVSSVAQYSSNAQLSGSVDVQGKFACYSTPKYQSGLIHYAVVGPLQPSTLYFYRCGDPSRGWSGVFNFTSPPQPGLQGLPYKIAAVGDLGQTKHTENTLSNLQRSAAHIILNVGDLAYADGVQRLWDRFGRMIENVTSTIPMAVALGNHDFENMQLTPASSKTQIYPRLLPYQLRFHPPGAHEHGHMFFSFKVSAAHITILATYAPYKRGSPQYNWLDSDLSKVDRTVTPWVIIVMHASWYHSNHGHAWELQAMADAVEPLLFKHHVDVVFAGHTHAYERTARLYRNKLNECGAYHVLVGDGGNREGLANKWRNPKPDWSLYRASRFGHGVLELVNATHARWGWRHNREEPGHFTDTAWMVHDPGCVGRQQEPAPAMAGPDAAASPGLVQKRMQL